MVRAVTHVLPSGIFSGILIVGGWGVEPARWTP